MKNTKLLVVSALGALVSVGALVGGTFAIFTSEEKTNIAVTSGKVSVSAEIQDLKLYSGEWNDVTNSYDSKEVTGTFTNGGTAVLEDGSLKLDKISAMDKATFKIHVKNNSNIQAKYKITTKLAGDIDLFTALDVKINNEEYLGFTTSSGWEMMALDYEEDIEVEVGLPEEADGSAQGKNVNISFAVEAVQGNAHTVELDYETGEIPLYTESDLRLFANYANANKMNNQTAVLMDDINLGGVEWTKIDGFDRNITFNGNGHTISNLKISEGHNAGFFERAYNCTIKNVTFDNASVSGVGRVGVAVGHGLCAHINNVTVKNSKVSAVVTDNDDGDKVGAIVGYLSAESNAEVIDSKVENCEIAGFRDVGGAIGYAAGTYQIKNVEVKNTNILNNKLVDYKNYATDAEYDVNEVIGEDTNAGVKENITFDNVTIKSGYFASSAEELAEFSSIVNSGNTFNGKTLTLLDDIDLAGIEWEPIGTGIAFEGTIDGNGKTISNMKAVGESRVGFIGNYLGMTIKNITFDNAFASGVEHSAIVAGYTGGGGFHIENVTVKNSKFVGKYNDDKDDGCNSFGMICGYVQPGGTDAYMTGCKVENCEINGYRRLGGLIGHVNGTIGGGLNLANNSVKGLVINQDMSINYKNFTENGMYCDALVGQYGGTIDATNTSANYTINVL